MLIPRSHVAIGIAVVSVTLAARTGGAAHQASPQGDLLGSLLSEVRALRLAMERSATVTPRVQLTLARLNIQEQRTVSLGRDLDQIRQQQASARLEAKKLTDELEDVQKALQTAKETSQRNGLDSEEQALKRKLAQQTEIEERLRAREG